MVDVAFVLGTRPQIIKSAPVIKKFLNRGHDVLIIHTGQHYDYELNGIFFREFDIPAPDYFLNVGSGSHGFQVGEVVKRVEKVLERQKPSVVIVPGDTNSALGAAIASAKLNVITIHLEAGLRVYSMMIQEELNRRLIDAVSHVLLAPTRIAYENLLREGKLEAVIKLVGDTMLDALLHLRKTFTDVANLDELGLEPRKYLLMSLHRDFNTDVESRLTSIVSGVLEAVERARDLRVVFLVHPRTRKKLAEYGLLERLRRSDYFVLLSPQSYSVTINLLENSAGVLTDSGGLQKEAFILGKKTVTFRAETEWVETVQNGANFLVDADKVKITSAVSWILDGGIEDEALLSRKAYVLYGAGKASDRIVKLLESMCVDCVRDFGVVNIRKLERDLRDIAFDDF